MLANATGATGEVLRVAKSSVIQASITLLTFPVHLLGRIRKLDRWKRTSENFFAFHDLHSDEFLLSQSPPPPVSGTPLPGPWSFLISWYVFGLIMMAVLLHRIRNIVVPRNQFITRFTRTTRHRAFPYSAIPSVFPLDLSSSTTRLVLRSPSLYLIFKMVGIWLVVLAQAADKFPAWNSSWVQSVGTYVSQRETADLCWATFCAVCGVLCMEGLTHGLEGGAHRPSPFNLLGYAFLLHTYSSPVTHWITTEGSTSRPDKHVVFTILLPLLQLAIIHLIGIKQDWSSHRLFPSAFVSFLTLTHFHSVLWLSDSSYPLLSYVPCLFESTLLAIVFLALFLNVLHPTRHRGHSLARPIRASSCSSSSMGRRLLSGVVTHGYSKPRGVERVGAWEPGRGCSSAHPPPPSLDRKRRHCRTEPLRHIIPFPGVQGPIKHRRPKKGFSNEIKNVRVTTSGGDIWVDTVWCRELGKLGVGVVRCVRGLVVRCWNLVKRRTRKPPNFPPRRVVVRTEATKSERKELDTEEEEEEEELYARFMRGESMEEDDEDFEYYPSETERKGSSSPTSSRSEHGNDEDEDQEEDEEEESPRQDASETISLFSDLSSAPSAMTSASVLVAHMTHNSPLPMTRQRFQHLMSAPSHRSDSLLSDWSDVAAIRRTSSSGTGIREDETGRNCVVCTVEPRQIIYVSLYATDCRENLASRSSASTHTCPCCRRNVDGYSKIYIP
ncbi:hypothetical protein EDD22DRAFT_890747 [Suillus occidentalis]|nr:hypothetical protein EDD22DRAFT_890747 [Suillus occidentalis]